MFSYSENQSLICIINILWGSYSLLLMLDLLSHALVPGRSNQIFILCTTFSKEQSHSMAQIHVDTILFLIAAGIASYIIAISIYRLYLHPLAKFPGPRICAVTSLFELLSDFLGHGAYLYHIEEMHKKYGTHNVTHLENSCEASDTK